VMRASSGVTRTGSLRMIARPGLCPTSRRSYSEELTVFLRCEVTRLADFVAEVGAERMITLTLHTPNEAAALVHGH